MDLFLCIGGQLFVLTVCMVDIDIVFQHALKFDLLIGRSAALILLFKFLMA